MKTIFAIITLMAFLLVNCSTSTEPTNISALSITKNDNSLKINNDSFETVYLFVVERGRAAFLNWAPNFNDPKISAKDSININYNNIVGLEYPIKSGDEIIVYYWYKLDETNPEVFAKGVKL
ncbi:MAG: hypothetical protein L3J41_17070 [Melioribacteraceae bacterium]|nr:hypothetical protein [Melioribacteraceae bacterium]